MLIRKNSSREFKCRYMVFIIRPFKVRNFLRPFQVPAFSVRRRHPAVGSGFSSLFFHTTDIRFYFGEDIKNSLKTRGEITKMKGISPYFNSSAPFRGGEFVLLASAANTHTCACISSAVIRSAIQIGSGWAG